MLGTTLAGTAHASSFIVVAPPADTPSFVSFGDSPSIVAPAPPQPVSVPAGAGVPTGAIQPISRSMIMIPPATPVAAAPAPSPAVAAALPAPVVVAQVAPAETITGTTQEAIAPGPQERRAKRRFARFDPDRAQKRQSWLEARRAALKAEHPLVVELAFPLLTDVMAAPGLQAQEAAAQPPAAPQQPVQAAATAPQPAAQETAPDPRQVGGDPAATYRNVSESVIAFGDDIPPPDASETVAAIPARAKRGRAAVPTVMRAGVIGDASAAPSVTAVAAPVASGPSSSGGKSARKKTASPAAEPPPEPAPAAVPAPTDLPKLGGVR